VPVHHSRRAHGGQRDGPERLGRVDELELDHCPIVFSRVATRRTRRGGGYRPDQGIGVERALRAYTSGSARALGVEAEAGTLAPRKRADLVALSGDPLETDPERLDELSVERTWLAGELVYQA
jgi:predicted amidohydrolase YtcJ